MDIDQSKNYLNDDKTARKCNQCEYTFPWASDLRRHLKIHNGEKLNKCNQCDYASSHAFTLRPHLKTHSGENQTNATNVALPIKCNWLCIRCTGNLRRHKVEKANKCNQCDNVSSSHMKTENTTWRIFRQMQQVWIYREFFLTPRPPLKCRPVTKFFRKK